MIDHVVTQALEGDALHAAEIAELFQAPLFSRESALILAASRRLAELASQGQAEVHAQVGLNVAPCPNNCAFCSFAAVNGVFRESRELSVAQAVARARQFEQDGANAIFIMATADYDFGKFIEMGREIKRNLDPGTVLVANVGDFDLAEAERLKAAGFTGVYHALRLGEGRDTGIAPELRLATMRHAREAGLSLGTCLEPVGPEHTIAELVEKTLVTRDASPAYSGAARRISIPGTDLSRHGMVSEARMAHLLAVVRLALPHSVPGNCTHEPNVLGAAAGANLLWAESGSNPRDTHAETEQQRGLTVADCRNILREAEWRVLEGPSRFYTRTIPERVTAG